MKPRQQGGVVDKRLNVYGVTGLKCVDLSICPVRTFVWYRAFLALHAIVFSGQLGHQHLLFRFAGW